MGQGKLHKGVHPEALRRLLYAVIAVFPLIDAGNKDITISYVFLLSMGRETATDTQVAVGEAVENKVPGDIELNQIHVAGSELAHEASSGERKRAPPGLSLLILASAGLSYILQQTVIIPGLPTIQKELNTTPTWSTWVFTGFLLTSSVCTPLLGKLGDIYGKKKMLLVSLAIFGVGTLVAALSRSIALLIIARGLQGAAGAIFPIAYGIIRDEFPPERVSSGLSLLSATFGLGGGIGLILSGVILESLHWSWLFWIGLIPIVIAMVLVYFVLPESRVLRPSKLDIPGAASFSIALVALLFALSKGLSWGWSSAGTILLFAGSAALFGVFLYIETKVSEPLVDVAMLKNPAVLWTNWSAVFCGMSMYLSFLLVPNFCQVGRGFSDSLKAKVNYGFSASVIQAGVFVIPASVMMLCFGPIIGKLEPIFGAKALVITGSLILGFSGLFLALWHSKPWEIYVAMAFVGMGISFVYSMFAKVIMDNVSKTETGIAMGMNTVFRTVGSVLGAQIGAAVIASDVIPDTGGKVPSVNGFIVAFYLSAGSGLVGAFCAMMIPQQGKAAEKNIAEASAISTSANAAAAGFAEIPKEEPDSEYAIASSRLSGDKTEAEV